MQVFLSWSGELSHAVAELLHDWLPSVLQTVDPFLSSDTIDKGSRWNKQVTEGLRGSGFGILCLTKENLNSPWMTFEAGALSEGLSSDHVCPLLIDVGPDAVHGPLGDFQATRLDKPDAFKLIVSINRALDPHGVEHSRLERLFEAMWPDFESAVNAALMASAEQHTGAASGDVVSSRTFKLLASRGTLINPADESRNISFKVETVNLLLRSLADAICEHAGVDGARRAFEEAGYKAAATFGERIHERWGLEYPDDSVSERVSRWCTFDSDVGWGRLVNELVIDEESDTVTGSIRLLDNFQTYKRADGEHPDCYLMHGYVRGVLEALTDGTRLDVECDQDQCPLLHRRRRDCVFKVSNRQ